MDGGSRSGWRFEGFPCGREETERVCFIGVGDLGMSVGRSVGRSEWMEEFAFDRREIISEG